MNLSEGLKRINGKDFVLCGRLKELAHHNARRVAFHKGARIFIGERHGNLLEKRSRIARPIELRNRPERHIALDAEGFVGIEAVQGHIFAHHQRRRAADAPAGLLRLLNRFLWLCFFGCRRRDLRRAFRHARGRIPGGSRLFFRCGRRLFAHRFRRSLRARRLFG